MNQILVTEKLYITPELKRKKKAYKVSFFLSIFLMIALSCMYIYAEYDRNRLEDSSQDILKQIAEGNLNGVDATLAPQENALIVTMSQEQGENIDLDNTLLGEEERRAIQSGIFTDSKGNQYSIVGIVNIPKINCRYPIIAETTDLMLKVSVCKFWGSAPNEVGNLCIIGHNYKNSKFFSKVPSLIVGDIIEITDLSGRTLQYKAYDIYTVDPSDTRCTSQLTQGKKEVTLITCTNDTKQRVIVKCTEVI